ncbi:MAG: 2-oxoacid:acceptor oxidoreductase family protein, partial [Chloroflexi bacterium]|nr:2-oxoacid:acceptor oxidoreductase family protein [Chloroflexota bacterium]
MDRESVVVINTTKKPGDFDFSERFRVATVDAAGVSIRHGLLVGGIPIINTPILGAMPRVSKMVSLESIQDAIREQWKGKPGEENAQAARDAYELTEVNFS